MEIRSSSIENEASKTSNTLACLNTSISEMKVSTSALRSTMQYYEEQLKLAQGTIDDHDMRINRVDESQSILEGSMQEALSCLTSLTEPYGGSGRVVSTDTLDKELDRAGVHVGCNNEEGESASLSGIGSSMTVSSSY